LVEVGDGWLTFRLSLGLLVLLIGVWYCYKRGKEERLKEEDKLPSVLNNEPQNQEQEILVEGTKPQENDTDHGLGRMGSPAGLEETRVLRDAAIHMQPVVDSEDTDTPLQIESDVVHVPGPTEKKIKKRWFQ
jgi:cbb3-type cytochrome oxidase subunit 3